MRDFNDALEALNRKENRSFTVTASAGFEVRRLEEMDTIERCIQLSDQRLYAVKAIRHTARTE